MPKSSKKEVDAPASAGRPAADGTGQTMPANVRVRTRTRATAPEPPKEPKGDYEVGYKKPPKHSQFKKGQRANPNGRPKGARNLRTEFLEEMNEPITIRENGKAKKVTKLRAWIKRLSEKALNGETKAIHTALGEARKYLPESETEPEPDIPLAEEDLALLIEFAGRQRSRK